MTTPPASTKAGIRPAASQAAAPNSGNQIKKQYKSAWPEFIKYILIIIKHDACMHFAGIISFIRKTCKPS